VERSGIRVGKRREAPARIAIVRAPLAFRKTVKFVAVTTVMAGLVPAISIIGAPRAPDRDRRAKPGDDGSLATGFVPLSPELNNTMSG